MLLLLSSAGWIIEQTTKPVEAPPADDEDAVIAAWMQAHSIEVTWTSRENN